MSNENSINEIAEWEPYDQVLVHRENKNALKMRIISVQYSVDGSFELRLKTNLNAESVIS